MNYDISPLQKKTSTNVTKIASNLYLRKAKSNINCNYLLAAGFWIYIHIYLLAGLCIYIHFHLLAGIWTVCTGLLPTHCSSGGPEKPPCLLF